MSFSDETLAAYVDGELDADARAAVDEALRTDSGIAQRLSRYRALRSRLRAAYEPELQQPVPERLLATLRATRTRKLSPGIMAAAPWRYSLAAGVLIAVGAGLLVWRHEHAGAIETLGGMRVARGNLAEGLSNQLSGDAAPGSDVRIGLSFVAKSGDYCRTFSLADDAGIACRRAGRWEILALAQRQPATAADSRFRTASSEIPAQVLQALDQQMSGEPLDRVAEIAARAGHWNGAAPH
jgi:hypothetical protein